MWPLSANGEHAVNGFLAEASAPPRVMSIDALRGFDMFWIIGGTPVFITFLKLFINPLPEWFVQQFEHKDWNGFSAEDLIMPLFLFVVGCAMPFSFGKRVQQGQTRGELYMKIIRRVVILWFLGMIYQGNLCKYDWDQLLLYSNTLQAIAAGYALAAVIMLNLGVSRQIAALALLLVGYWALLAFVPVPGHGKVIMEPDANLALWIDDTLLGHFHRGSYVWILPSLGFTATTLLGVMAGYLLRCQRSRIMIVALLIAIGVGSLGAGHLWGLALPINKHMWNSPMVLWSGGFCFLLLATFYLVIDVIQWRAWAYPFIVIGSNAITAYMLWRIANFRTISDYLVGAAVPRLGAWGDFLHAFIAFMSLWLLLWYMHRNRTFIRI